jgi:hypothetical protein
MLARAGNKKGHKRKLLLTRTATRVKYKNLTGQNPRRGALFKLFIIWIARAGGL